MYLVTFGRLQVGWPVDGKQQAAAAAAAAAIEPNETENRYEFPCFCNFTTLLMTTILFKIS